MLMPFGRYRGQELATLPAEYLQWLAGIELREPLASAVQEEVERRNAEAKQLAEHAKPLKEHGGDRKSEEMENQPYGDAKEYRTARMASLSRPSPKRRAEREGAWTIGGDPQELIRGDYPISSRKR